MSASEVTDFERSFRYFAIWLHGQVFSKLLLGLFFQCQKSDWTYLKKLRRQAFIRVRTKRSRRHAWTEVFVCTWARACVCVCTCVYVRWQTNCGLQVQTQGVYFQVLPGVLQLIRCWCRSLRWGRSFLFASQKHRPSAIPVSARTDHIFACLCSHASVCSLTFQGLRLLLRISLSKPFILLQSFHCSVQIWGSASMVAYHPMGCQFLFSMTLSIAARLLFLSAYWSITGRDYFNLF